MWSTLYSYLYFELLYKYSFGNYQIFVIIVFLMNLQRAIASPSFGIIIFCDFDLHTTVGFITTGTVFANLYLSFAC